MKRKQIKGLAEWLRCSCEEQEEAILKTFGGNEATKKTKKNQLKQQYGTFKAEGSETLEQTFNRLQAIMSHIEFMNVEIKQDDLNQKFLTSLALEWLMYTIVWRNRDDIDTISLDDVYNHLKVYEPEVQKKSESNSQNMAFISSSNTSSGKAASLSHDTVCAYIASQSNGSQIKYKDITQIDEDDIEEMDIKWNMALLSFDKSKVECFNFHKWAILLVSAEHLEVKTEEKEKATNKEENHALIADDEVPTEFTLMAKSSSSSENKESLLGHILYRTPWPIKGVLRKNTENLNTKISKLNEELSDCETDLHQYKRGLLEVEARLVEFKEHEINNYEKNKGLERDVEVRNNKIEYLMNELEQVRKEKKGLDNKLTCFESASEELDNLLGSQISDKNKEGLGYNAVPPSHKPTPSIDASKCNTCDLQSRNFSVFEHGESSGSIISKPMIKFVNASDCPRVIKTNNTKNARKSTVKYAKMYMNTLESPKVRGLPEFVDDTVTDYSRPTPSIDALKCNTSDLQSINFFVFEHGESLGSIMSKPMIKFVKAANCPRVIKTINTENARKSTVKYAEIVWVEKGKTWLKNNFTHKRMTPKVVLLKPGTTPIAVSRPNMNVAQPKMTYFAKTTHSNVKRPFQGKSAVRTQPRVPRVSTVTKKIPTVDSKFPTAKSTFTADLGNKGKADNPHNIIDDKGYWDSGCSRHMTGNISYLSESMIGSLMYLTASRPDIMFAVRACARHQVLPKECHLYAIIRIFRYLKGHLKLGLWYPKEYPFDLVAYSDSDYGGATQDRKSTTGGCQFRGRMLILWQCKKQTIIATSTTKAEYVAAASGYGQVLWIQNLMLDYGQYTRRAKRIAQSKAFSPAADELASLSRDDRQREAFPIVSSLDAGQDRENIAKTSALPYESSLKVTSLNVDESSMQHRIYELMKPYTSLQRKQSQMAAKIKDQDLEISGLKARVKSLKDKNRRSVEPTQEEAPITGGIMKIKEELGPDKSTELGSNDTEEMVNVLSSMEAANILTSRGVAASVSPAEVLPATGVPTVSGSFPTHMRSPIIRAKDKGKQKVVESEVPKKRKLQEQIDVQVAKEMEKEFARESQRLSEQLARDSKIARLHAEEELKMMIECLDRSNEVITKHLQEYEQAEVDLSVGEKLELINELVKYQDHCAKILKYQAQQSKPLLKKEQREFYMDVLKSHARWKTKHFRGMTLEQIKEKFIPV
uniref:Uncharacterized mitochondrial protein AtMg00810-like n=1 Tax=Tanacetum cinerariifolium TaxID=118510 RepID=A0A6L2LQ96_TANCI|nr:uncharacterized mitochondrial protein AtMg00810-like [Tanacetum cinerariifolium]